MTRAGPARFYDLGGVRERLDANSLEMVSAASPDHIIEFRESPVDERCEELRDIGAVLQVSLCFRDSPRLELHRVVSEIVDQSGQGARVEKKLGSVRGPWTEAPVTLDQPHRFSRTSRRP